MPAGDGTGPFGRGPQTGRGAGYCSGYDAPGWVNPGPGRGFGLGRGGGWRHRNWYRATGIPGRARLGYGPAWRGPADWDYGPSAPAPGAPAPGREHETGSLRQQAEWLTEQLEAIGRRIAELEQEK
jgi:hypothetical protein